MGALERLVDRQLAGGDGDFENRVRMIRRGQKFLLVAVVLGLFLAAFNLANGGGSPDRSLWAVVGIGWLGVSYLLLRQWRYLDQRKG